jgi:hypothetical protein
MGQDLEPPLRIGKLINGRIALCQERMSATASLLTASSTHLYICGSRQIRDERPINLRLRPLMEFEQMLIVRLGRNHGGIGKRLSDCYAEEDCRH